MVADHRNVGLAGIYIPVDQLGHLVAPLVPLALDSLHHGLGVSLAHARVTTTPVVTGSGVELHVTDNQDVLRHVALRYAVGQSSVQHHIESGFDIGVLAQVGTHDAINLVTEVDTFGGDQLRTRAEADVVISERTACTLGAVQTQSSRYIDRSTRHGTGGINHAQGIQLGSLEEVSQIVPVLVDHQAIHVVHSDGLVTPITLRTHQSNSLLYNLVRVECGCIDLSVLILGELLILRLDDIAASKGVLIDKTSLGRDLIELNLVPAVCGHQHLKDVDARTQDRQSLAVLTMGHTHVATGDVSQTMGFTRAGILGLQPLRQQGRGLALYVQSKLLLHQRKGILLQRSSYQAVQVVPTTELREVLDVLTNRLPSVLAGSRPGHNGAEETTLTLATAHVADVEEHLHGQLSILCERLLEHQDDIFIRAVTHSRAHSEHVKQIAIGGLMGDTTIFGHGPVGSRLHTIQQSIHSFFSPLFFSFKAWTSL